MSTNATKDTTGAASTPVVAGAWLWVTVPFLYGVYQLVLKVQTLFG